MNAKLSYQINYRVLKTRGREYEEFWNFTKKEKKKSRKREFF